MLHRAWLAPVAFLCLTSAPAIAAAQAAAAKHSPPKVLQIFVESVKTGKSAAHEKVEIGWPAAFRKAKWPTNYLAITSVTGPSEAWYLTGYESYAALETDGKNIENSPVLAREMARLSELDGELLTGARGVTATYRPDLSYRADFDIATQRYFALSIVTLKPGYDSAYTDIRRLVSAGHEKANLDEHWAMYQVSSGMAGNTYLLFVVMKSLQEADQAVENHKKPYQDALGEAARIQMRDFQREGIQSVDNRLFAFSPKMSYPSPAWVASDPQFWAPKPVAMTKP